MLLLARSPAVHLEQHRNKIKYQPFLLLSEVGLNVLNCLCGLDCRKLQPRRKVGINFQFAVESRRSAESSRMASPARAAAAEVDGDDGDDVTYGALPLCRPLLLSNRVSTQCPLRESERSIKAGLVLTREGCLSTAHLVADGALLPREGWEGTCGDDGKRSVSESDHAAGTSQFPTRTTTPVTLRLAAPGQPIPPRPNFS